MPELSPDPVVDFMVVEAMTAKVRAGKIEAQEKAERKRRLQSHRQLRGKRGGDRTVIG